MPHPLSQDAPTSATFAPDRTRIPGRAAASILALALACAGTSRAQEIFPQPPDAIPGVLASDSPFPRAPLLREGSHIVRVLGHLRADEQRGTWELVIDPSDPHSPGHVLTVLPGTLLAEMERLVRSAEGQRLIFQISGQVYVYRARNYFMLTHPPVLVGHEEPPPPDPPTGEETDDPVDDGSAGVTTDPDSTDAIIRELERSAGRIGRRAGAPLPAGTETPAGTIATSAGGEPLVREGTIMLERRGKIRRSAGGAYVFVFDADAEGLGDPPMTLLPCLLLERLEHYARQAGERAAVLITGHVYTYRGQNYLRPTVYQIPRERTKLTP